jgi:hypothetical protein
MTVAERSAAFWAKVNVTSSESDCWEWTGAKNALGYGNFWDGRYYRAHNWSLREDAGSPPEGKSNACHTCDNPSCVNPRHLYWGSQQENIDDAISRGRFYLKPMQEFCKNGHPLEDPNLYYFSNGGRACKTCSTERSKASEVKRKLRRQAGKGE